MRLRFEREGRVGKRDWIGLMLFISMMFVALMWN